MCSSKCSVECCIDLFCDGQRKEKHGNGSRADANGPIPSPYGCHANPDIAKNLHLKLNSLPNEPLRKGEQYFLDLAGNIQKVMT